MRHETCKCLTGSLADGCNNLVKDEVTESIESKDTKKLDGHVIAPSLVHFSVVLLQSELDLAAARALSLEELSKTKSGTVTCFPSWAEEVDTECIDNKAERPFARSDLKRVGSRGVGGWSSTSWCWR